MSFYIKRPSTIDSSDEVYWKGDNQWTEDFSEKKDYSNKTDADAQVATTVTVNGYTYTPVQWQTSTVVEE